jgi:beta-lactamase superfamily II metal-dependent hydrolase
MKNLPVLQVYPWIGFTDERQVLHFSIKYSNFSTRPEYCVPSFIGRTPNERSFIVKHAFAALAITTFAILNIGFANEARQSLDIYFLDMNGGASTLIVTPMGESVLIDTGSLEPKHRDADRIYLACRHARLKHIDYLITTHFHSDHYGGILELTKRIPVKRFMDKGTLPLKPEQDNKIFKMLYPLYQQATKGNVTPLHAGDDVPLKNDSEGKIPLIRLHCVASQKNVEGFDGDIDAPAEGFEFRDSDESENARSIALVLTYGRFRFFAGGDITWNVEHHLAHPVNRIGKVDLYQVTHHGLDQSNNPTLLEALSPTVCVAMNGPKKGIQPNTFRTLNALPSVKAIYQIHYNILYGDEGNMPDEFIANEKDSERGGFIKASVDAKRGTFSVSIGVGGPKREFSIQ